MIRVLVVDDDPVILRLLELNLELEGHEVFTAEDGRAALDRAYEQAPDLILLDIMMPELDGFHVCQQLRADERTRDIPIVFLSAKAQAADIDRGTAVGADAYVTKPFDPQELVELVEGLVARGRAPSRDDVS